MLAIICPHMTSVWNQRVKYMFLNNQYIPNSFYFIHFLHCIFILQNIFFTWRTHLSKIKVLSIFHQASLFLVCSSPYSLTGVNLIVTDKKSVSPFAWDIILYSNKLSSLKAQSTFLAGFTFFIQKSLKSNWQYRKELRYVFHKRTF